MRLAMPRSRSINSRSVAQNEPLPGLSIAIRAVVGRDVPFGHDTNHLLKPDPDYFKCCANECCV
jgi:hypothetical protein